MVDIRAAETAVQRLVDYIDEMDNAGTHPYAKTRQRVREIVAACIHVVTTASRILDEDLLQEISTCQLRKSDSKDSEICERLAQLTKAVEGLNPCNNISSHEEAEGEAGHLLQSDEPLTTAETADSVPEVPQVANPVVNTTADETAKSVTPFPKLSPVEKRIVVRTYADALQHGANTSCKYHTVNVCAQLIWTWFDARILTKHPNAPPFTYGIHRIRQIIQSIVLAYGYHVEHDSTDAFLKQFEHWFDSLDTSPGSHRWVAPFEIYSIERGNDDEYLNLTAVVLWDMLIDFKYTNLIHTRLPPDSNDHHQYYLSEVGLWDLIKSKNMEILDAYDYYEENPKLLESLKII